jgi:hypothetical protein
MRATAGIAAAALCAIAIGCGDSGTVGDGGGPDATSAPHDAAPRDLPSSADDLAIADSSTSDLAIADFSTSDLAIADSSTSDLAIADFSTSDLARADFSTSDLARADSSTSDLARADFSTSDLARADSSMNDLAAPATIYWGALEEGPDTYDFYYGPAGFWQTAPWGNTGNTMDRFDSNAGKKVSVLHYGQPPPWDQTTFYTGTMDIVWNRGAVPLVTMSLGSSNLATVAGGSLDASIATWAGAVKTYGKPFWLRFAWEMNGDWYAWGQQPAAYIAAWRHFHDVVVQAGATNVTWLWCPNLDYGPNKLAAYYPGDAYVDWMGLDGYNKGPASTSFAALYQSSYAQLVAISSKPIVIAETSSLEYATGAKAAWITDLLGTQLPTAFPQIKAVVWFNWRFFETDNGVTQNQPFPIESSTSAQTAFHDGIANPYYRAGGTFAVPPPLSKVPIP